MWVTVAIFALTYVVLAVGRFPGFRMDRTGAAIIGATLMVANGALTMEQAWKAINYDTILLLFGMMIVVANLRVAGFFRLVAYWVIRRMHHPKPLLAAVIGVSGVLSAFFVNDTMCLILTPLLLEITKALGRNPVPYLLAVAISANIGSAATITGNPQNMIIGTLSQIPYARFAAALSPVSAAGLVITFVVIGFVYRREFADASRVEVGEQKVVIHWPLLWKSLAVSAAMIGLFFAGWPVAKVAIVSAAVLLITRRVNPEKIYREIDFGLLVMFSGLFVVVAGVEKTSVAADLVRFAESLQLNRLWVLTGIAAVLSNIMSNVPAVLVFKPVMPHLADAQRSWLALALATTFAGNLTVVGSVANLIVVERARPVCQISFWDYFRVGAPVTVLTLAAGVLWLGWR